MVFVACNILGGSWALTSRVLSQVSMGITSCCFLRGRGGGGGG